MKLSVRAMGSVLSLALLSFLPTLASAQSLGTPEFTSATVESCNGLYLVDWSAVAGATTYDIWVQYPGTTSYSLLKAAAGTQTSLRAANSTQSSYFEIQACNASGCGPLSSPLQLAFYSGCP